jgi:hypothetical protein
VTSPMATSGLFPTSAFSWFCSPGVLNSGTCAC